MKISVVIPAYNAKNTLARSVKSILSQTYQDIEVIIINDGSNDNTWDICQQLQNSDERIIIYNKENQGPSSARNKGIELSNGYLLTFVDADDYIDKSMYVEMMKEFNSSVDLLICNYSSITSSGSVISHKIEVDTINEFESKESIYRKFLEDDVALLGSCCNKIYKASLIKDGSLKFDENKIRAEDYWFNLKYLKITEKYKFINEPYYKYVRDTPSSIMKSVRDGWYDEIKNNRLELIQYLTSEIVTYDVNKYITKELHHIIEHLFLMNRNHGEKDKVVSIIADMKYSDKYSINLLIHLPMRYMIYFVYSKLANPDKTYNMLNILSK